MSVGIDAERLKYEMARRGLSASELARAARLSPQTVGAALAGREISSSSLRLIGSALGDSPIIAVIDALLRPKGGARAVE
jgi:transcriptional regulator with XRE-family HTH domain